MARDRLVFLVPGFFGFSKVGEVSYYADVERGLGEALERYGIKARIVRCVTQPTASIPRRANRLREQVIEEGGLAARELHFVGHSTGGLDVRMLLTPGVRIAAGDTEERIAARTRTAISVATPHHGTPLANHFLTVQGHTLLLLLTGLATSGQGPNVLVAAARALRLAASLGDRVGSFHGVPGVNEAQVLADLAAGGGEPVLEYLADIRTDQGAVLQLTPEGIDLFNASVVDRSGVAYGCVVAGSPPPGVRIAATAVLDPGRLIRIALFRLLYLLTTRPHPHYPYPKPRAAIQRRLDRGLGFTVTPRSNDGIVPTLSQLHGRLLHVARADHMDVVGHYTLADRAGDWLPSGAGFTDEAFATTWDAVARTIAGHR